MNPENIEKLKETLRESPLTASAKIRMLTELGSLFANDKRLSRESENDFNLFVEECEKLGHLNPRAYDDAANYREHAHTIHFPFVFARTGFNVFNLTHGLAAGLLLTDEPKLRPGEEVKLPFPAYIIVPPPETVPMFVDGQQVWGDMIMVQRFDSVYAHTQEVRPFLRWIVMWKTLSLWQDRDVFDIQRSEDENFYNVPELGDPPPVDEDKISLRTARHLWHNLGHWLDASGGTSALTPLGKPRMKKGPPVTWPTTWVVSRDVKIDRALRDIAKEVALGRTKHAIKGWSLRMKHVVRGHWKMQPHGSHLGHRKRIWVEPYIRGPEGSEAWSHIYRPKS